MFELLPKEEILFVFLSFQLNMFVKYGHGTPKIAL